MAFEREGAPAQGRAYEFVCDIARGGMGAVALVLRREADFTRTYAEKRLLPSFASDPAVRAMFMDEARIAGLLRHPNVVSVHDVGSDERGAYLLMDYVEGVALTRLMQHAARSGEHTPLQICLDIVAQAARGLHAAHALVDHDGIVLELVHRDVSPHNILVGFDGIVRVTDFGIARAVGRRSRTSTGMLKGKTGYLAPEALRFEPTDRRADLFSIGIVLYELVTGARLYRETDDTETARRILHEAPPDLGMARAAVPDELVRLTFELLAKDPSHRPATAKEVARRLEAIRQDLVALEGEIELDVYLSRSLDQSDVRARRTMIHERERGATTPATVPVPSERSDASRGSPEHRRSASPIAVVLLAIAAAGLATAIAIAVVSSTDAAELGARGRLPDVVVVPAAVLEGPPAGADSPGAEREHEHERGRATAAAAEHDGCTSSLGDQTIPPRSVRTTGEADQDDRRVVGARDW